MAAETKSHQHELEEGLLLPVVSDEKRFTSTDDTYPGSGYRGSTTTSTHERTTDRMVKVRGVLVTLVAFLFLSFGLTSVIAAHVGCSKHHGGADAQRAMAGPGTESSELSEPASTVEPDLLHRLLHAYFPKSFQDGVYASDEDALSAVEAEDSGLGATLAQIAKRQDGNNTEPTPTPSSPSEPSTPATNPPSSPSQPPPVTTSNPPPVVTITTTAPPPPVTTTSEAPPPPPASSTPGETSTPPAPPPQDSTTQAPPPSPSSSEQQPQEPSTTAPSAAASSQPGTSQAEQSSTTPNSSSEPSTSTFTSLIRTSQTPSPSPSSSSPEPTTTTITNTASSASSSSSPETSSETSPSTTPTTATTSPTSSAESTQATVVTTTRSSSRAQSSSAVLATRTTTDAEGDLVYVTETSYVGVDPSPQTTSGSAAEGGDLQDAAPRAVAGGLALGMAAAVGALLL